MEKKAGLGVLLVIAGGILGAISWVQDVAGAPNFQREPRALVEETAASAAERELDFPELAALLESHLTKNLPDQGMKVEIRDIRVHERVRVPAGRVSCKVWIPEPLRRGGLVGAQLIFYSQGREVQRCHLQVLVDLYQTVAVARRYLKRHEEIQGEDIELVPVNLKFLPPDAVTDPLTIVGKRTLVHVKGQEPLRAGLVDVPPLVKKGDLVQVIVDKNNIRVSCLGEIKETGRRGDRVKLVNLSSKKELLGRVLDGGTVQVDGH
jgi:flagella basal body P-ring formation protein FlgA